MYPIKETCLLLAMLAVLAACSQPARVESKSGQPEANPEAQPVAAVKATRQTLTRELTISAEFRPFEEIELHAKIAGFLKEITVDVGDVVKAGQLIARLEVPELQEELVTAEATKKRSEAEVLRAQVEISRALAVHESGHLSYSRLAAVSKSRPELVAQQELDEAQARDKTSESQVAAARAALVTAEQQVRVSESSVQRVHAMLTYTEIRAPFAGMITKRFADRGAMIQAGTASQSQAMPVVRLSGIDKLRLTLPVPESATPQVRVGMPVEVRVASLSQSIRGVVARFTGSVQHATRTMETEVDVPNPTHKLIPGMFADAVIALDRHANVVSVPMEAVAQGAKPTAMVINGEGQLEERVLKLGLETPSRIEILDGLREGELVVIGSRGQLRPGQKVIPRIQPETKAAQ